MQDRPWYIFPIYSIESINLRSPNNEYHLDLSIYNLITIDDPETPFYFPYTWDLSNSKTIVHLSEDSDSKIEMDEYLSVKEEFTEEFTEEFKIIARKIRR